MCASNTSSRQRHGGAAPPLPRVAMACVRAHRAFERGGQRARHVLKADERCPCVGVGVGWQRSGRKLLQRLVRRHAANLRALHEP
eukprot:5181716-Pleurochrysis_carterae.AAC.4